LDLFSPNSKLDCASEIISNICADFFIWQFSTGGGKRFPLSFIIVDTHYSKSSHTVSF
jgi:hypothetical protein